MRRLGRRSTVWVGVALLLVAASMIVPVVTGEDVRVHFPPLHADWMPRWDWRVVPVALIGLGLIVWLPRWCASLSWRGLLGTAYAAAFGWTISVSMTEGTDGLARVFERKQEYVYDAQRVTSIHHMLIEFISRIPADAPDKWNVHVAGHPPGALLFFVLLDRLGITDPFWIGVATVAVGSTVVVAILLTLRLVGTEDLARRALPWLVLAPAVVYLGVTGDAMFAAVAAWGLYLLALAARRGSVGLAIAAGLVLGFCIFLSYGLVLLGILALAVLWVCRSWKPLPWAIGAALVVVAGFALAGFAWWEAFPVLHERYYAGIASERAYSYWVWGDLAAWTFTLGLATWAAVPRALERVRTDPMVQLALAGVATVLVASLSGMSKAEVERIFLPFTMWVLPLGAYLPEKSQRWWLGSQLVITLLLQQLLLTRW